MGSGKRSGAGLGLRTASLVALLTVTLGLPAPAAATVAPSIPAVPGSPVSQVAPGAYGVSPEDRCALLVGIDRFIGRTRPNYGARNDVMELRQALVQSGWPDHKIRVLVDEGARASHIRDGLTWLNQCSNERTLTVFHYSGHVKLFNPSSAGLWPHDNAFIRDTEVAHHLKALMGRAWINISGCEAALFDKGVSSPTRLFTASSRGDEKSYELVDAGNSVFNLLMVEEAMLRGQGDANRDGKVAVQEAFNYAAERAPEMTVGGSHGSQHPQIAGWDGTELFLAPAPPPAPPAARRCGLNLLFLCLF